MMRQLRWLGSRIKILWNTLNRRPFEQTGLPDLKIFLTWLQGYVLLLWKPDSISCIFGCYACPWYTLVRVGLNTSWNRQVCGCLLKHNNLNIVIVTYPLIFTIYFFLLCSYYTTHSISLYHEWLLDIVLGEDQRKSGFVDLYPCITLCCSLT